MTQLSKVLERMQSSLMQREETPSTSNLPLAGSTEPAGTMITQSGGVGSQIQKSPLEKQQTEPMMIWKNPVSSDRGSAKQLQEYVLQCFELLNVYGKTPEHLGTSVKMFIIMLADYPAVLIKPAFNQWIRTKSIMPTPADIIAIIEEDNSKLLDFVAHVRNGGYLADWAEEYIKSKLGNNWRERYV